MASGLDEVDAGMHTIIDDVHTVDLVLGIQVGIESLLDVLDNWSPRVIIVHEVTKARGINYGQAKADAILFDVCTDGLYADGLGCEIKRRLLSLFRWVQRGIEQSVDQS